MLSAILNIWSPDLGDGYALTTDLARIVDDIEQAIISPPYIRLTATGDASSVSTAHAFQIGPTDGVNLIADQNEIMARNGGNFNTLLLNYDGGDLSLGNQQSTTSVRGRLNPSHDSWGSAAGRVPSTAFSGSPGTVSSVSVTFPVGRFTATPVITPVVATVAPQLRMAAHSNRSASGMTINQYSEISGWGDVDWTAVQMTPTSATG